MCFLQYVRLSALWNFAPLSLSLHLYFYMFIWVLTTSLTFFVFFSLKQIGFTEIFLIFINFFRLSNGIISLNVFSLITVTLPNLRIFKYNQMDAGISIMENSIIKKMIKLI